MSQNETMNDKDNRDTQTGDPQPRFALTCFLPCFFTCIQHMFQRSSGASGCPNRTLGKASMLALGLDSVVASLRRCVVASLDGTRRHWDSASDRASAISTARTVRKASISTGEHDMGHRRCLGGNTPCQVRKLKC